MRSTLRFTLSLQNTLDSNGGLPVSVRAGAAGALWCSRMTPPAGEVLIVGDTGVGKRCLLSRLLNIKKLSSGRPLQQQQPWDLDTKYYTAQVLVERQVPTAKANPAAATCAGLVLVFAADQDSSFTAVRQWVEQLPSDVADVRLCVANKIDKLLSPHSSQQEPAVQCTPMLQEARQWCADSLFEYIEVSSTDTELDQNLVWEEQQQGVKRVKEALEAHMWPGLQMKPKQTQHEKHALPANHAGSETNQQDAKVSQQLQPEQNLTNSASEADTRDFQAFHNAEEAEFDQLDKMFEELRMTRDMMQGMPLHDRHDAAASAAMRLAAALGLDDESSSSEDDGP